MSTGFSRSHTSRARAQYTLTFLPRTLYPAHYPRVRTASWHAPKCTPLHEQSRWPAARSHRIARRRPPPGRRPRLRGRALTRAGCPARRGMRAPRPAEQRAAHLPHTCRAAAPQRGRCPCTAAPSSQRHLGMRRTTPRRLLLRPQRKEAGRAAASRWWRSAHQACEAQLARAQVALARGDAANLGHSRRARTFVEEVLLRSAQ